MNNRVGAKKKRDIEENAEENREGEWWRQGMVHKIQVR